MAKEQSATRERQRTDLREPRRYKVTIYNDDFTTMEFVVTILVQVFFKSEAEAEKLMLQVLVVGTQVKLKYLYPRLMRRFRPPLAPPNSGGEEITTAAEAAVDHGEVIA